MVNVKIITNGFITNNQKPVVVINLNGQVAVEMFYGGLVRFGSGLTPEFNGDETLSYMIDDLTRNHLSKMKTCKDRAEWFQNIENDIKKYTKMIKQAHSTKKGGN